MEDIYSDDSAMDSDNDNDYEDSDDGDDVEDRFMVVVNDSDVNPEPRNYTILKEEDIRRRLEDDIISVSSVLSVSRDAASILLRHYKWSVNNVHEAWFADEDGVRESLGLLREPVIQYCKNSRKKLTCGICFDTYGRSSIQTCSCGHPYCTDCWKSYITTAINDGHGFLLLRCPDPSCNAAVLEDLIHKLVSDEEKKRYHHYIFRSYVESNRKTKWCPAPGCDFAVEYVVGSESFDVFCLCSNSFCWNCTEEAHSPVDCDTVAKWVAKNSAESENVIWILANSKPCPQCKKPIEKNNGCMHMTCRAPCNFQFCWLCLGPWKEHDGSACNRYRSAKSKGEYDEDDKKREMAKKSIRRYTHYYERWASNNKSRDKALADLNEMKTVRLEKLSEELSKPVTELSFITEAWVQIVECRRVLKWTYAYGYYLPESEKAKQQLFEYLQGEAESGLERLHQCAERELEISIKDELINFRTKLTNLTRVTKTFFENLVSALANGLSDVGSSSKIRKREGSKITKASKSRKLNVSVSSSRSTMDNNEADDNTIGYWACSKCTYFNNQFATTCQMCSSR